MKRILETLLAAAVLSTAAASAFAISADPVEKSIPLKDGTTLHVFKDGAMAMEDKFGRAASMRQGEVMETIDGTKIVMHGDELARLDNFLNENRRN